MSYYSWQRRLKWKKQIHFFPFNNPEGFFFLSYVSLESHSSLYMTSVDKSVRCCSPILVGMATGSSIFSTMTMAILVFSHSASHSLLFVFLLPMFSSIDNVLMVFFLSLFHPNLTIVLLLHFLFKYITLNSKRNQGGFAFELGYKTKWEFIHYKEGAFWSVMIFTKQDCLLVHCPQR